MVVGYARVSTVEQNLSLQVAALEEAGCGRVFTDKVSGARSKRPGLDSALAALEEGDTFVVWKLDRLGRSMAHLAQVLEGLQAKGVVFRSLTDRVDTSTPSGKAMLGMLAVFAEFERDLIRERTKAGVAAAAAEGRKGGRPPKMTAPKLELAQRLREEGRAVRDIADTIGVSRSTLYAALKGAA